MPEVGDIVQISPAYLDPVYGPALGGCLCSLNKIEADFCICRLKMPQNLNGAFHHAWINVRVDKEHLHHVGPAGWIMDVDHDQVCDAPDVPAQANIDIVPAWEVNVFRFLTVSGLVAWAAAFVAVAYLISS